MSKEKRFSEWDDCQEVNCNQCDNWWTNQCDGVPKAQIRHCTSFKATRDIVIPQEIKRLKTRLNWLVWALVGLWFAIATLYFDMFGG